MSASGLQAALALGLAIALHLGAVAFRPGPAGVVSAGDGGADLVSVQVADPGWADLVADWDRAPDLAPEPVQLASPEALTPPSMPVWPEVGRQPLPVEPALPAVLTERPPDVDLTSPPPEAEPLKPLVRPEPKPRPETRSVAQKPVATGGIRQKALGTGGAARAGESGTASSATLSKAQVQDLTAGWGAAIRARIEQKKRYPSAAKGVSGSVTLRLTVTRAGQLSGVSVVKSSGSAVLDEAAVKAVRAAGRFPAAPRGLAKASYNFTLPMKFAR